MKTLHKALFTYFITILPVSVALSQNTITAKDLINQGIALNDSGKYPEAIAKYRDALNIDTANLQAQYEMSYTLASSGKPKEAIPYLQKIITTNIYAAAYDLLASIYDDEGDYEKAVTYYKQGIIAFPKYERLYFNLSVSYLRQKKYEEAETYSVSAIKLDPKHASSQRIYALATYNQGKRGTSLLAWSSFLILEPQTKRSAEAYKYLQNIIIYGIKQTGSKAITLSVNPKDTTGSNFLMPMAVLTATLDKKNLTRIDSLSLQLKSLFERSENYAPRTNVFFEQFFASYFKNLAASDNMPAFARYISFSAYPENNLKWFKENDEKLKALDAWIRTTNRSF